MPPASVARCRYARRSAAPLICFGLRASDIKARDATLMLLVLSCARHVFRCYRRRQFAPLLPPIIDIFRRFFTMLIFITPIFCLFSYAIYQRQLPIEAEAGRHYYASLSLY
jgi:hypothetical protein